METIVMGMEKGGVDGKYAKYARGCMVSLSVYWISSPCRLDFTHSNDSMGKIKIVSLDICKPNNRKDEKVTVNDRWN